MLVGKEVNVYKSYAVTQIAQGAKPMCKGKVMALSTYQEDNQSELVTFAVVMNADGTLEERPLGHLQVILKK